MILYIYREAEILLLYIFLFPFLHISKNNSDLGSDDIIDCYIPPEVLEGHSFTMSCYGTTDTKRLTTNQITVTLMLSGYTNKAKRLVANSYDKFEDMVFICKKSTKNMMI